VHAVEFKKGINVITGKSSTGKSAIIEIFDYCFGNSDYTVPEGVITSNAQLYFVVLAFPNTNLVLARKGNSNKAYIKEEANEDAIANPQLLQMGYFDKAFFLGLSDFKKELGRYFGLTITDIDEDLEAKKYRSDVKKPTPSVRSFTSLMLQHQNLIANKHAIFYRFDEKEKREQAIEHLKVFLGYADQNYFLLSQKLNGLRAELRRVEQQLPRQAEERKTASNKMEGALREYAAITGKHLVTTSTKLMIENPARWIEALKKSAVEIDGAATEFSKQASELNGRRSELVAKLRKLHLQQSAVRSSIEFAGKYMSEAQAIAAPEKVEIAVSECPFCHSCHHTIEHEANRLLNAIEWLNNELRRSPYLRESFEVDEQRLSKEISGVREEIRQIETQIAALKEQIDELDKRRPISELAIKAKLRVENILEDMLAKPASLLEEQKDRLKSQIKRYGLLLARYHMSDKLQEARRYIESAMAEIGNRFDFEETYKPVNLKFSLETFELWHETDAGRQVFLRAMGSGANWLYCHLSLFTALHRLFCYRGNVCNVPPILFLDQPSQVYFPSISFDNAQAFDARDLAQTAGKMNRLDEDIRAVENIYSELVKYCRQVLEETGLEPQIIVSDHADNLNLAEGIVFESLVRARWRTRGFINPVPEK
jgi:predicted DsbA family dithiol-disulfide isomerase